MQPVDTLLNDSYSRKEFADPLYSTRPFVLSPLAVVISKVPLDS